MDLANSIGSSLLGSYNAPGLASPIFGPGSLGLKAPSGYPGSSPVSLQSPGDAGYQDTLNQILALSRPQAAPQAAYFDTAAAHARARAAAEGAVNPLYTKRLQDFIDQQATNKARQQADTTTANQNLQDALSNTLQAIGTSRARTGQDTQTAIDNTNNQSDQYQADTGQSYDTARNKQAANLTNAGLITSGVGAGQQGQAQAARNTAEGRQGQAFTQAKDTANLLKSRTFADLATQETQANTQTAKGTAQNTLDLNRYIEDQSTALDAEKQQLEAQRLSDIASQSPGYYSNELSNFYSGLSGPALTASLQAYGS